MRKLLCVLTVTVCVLEQCNKNNIASDTGEADREKQKSKDMHINAVEISGPLIIRSLIVTLSLKLPSTRQSVITTEGLIVTVTLLLRHYL